MQTIMKKKKVMVKKLKPRTKYIMQQHTKYETRKEKVKKTEMKEEKKQIKIIKMVKRLVTRNHVKYTPQTVTRMSKRMAKRTVYETR